MMLARVGKVAVGGAVVAAVGAAMLGSLAAAKGKTAAAGNAGKEGDGIMVLNVSRQFVREHLSSQPQIVECLNKLSHMCMAEESGRATIKLRELVFHTAQLVYRFGAFASCETSEAVFRTHKKMQTIVTKVQRDCNALQLLLVHYVDVELLKETAAELATLLSNFMAMGDVVSDTMRQRLGYHAPRPARGAGASSTTLVVEHITEASVAKRMRDALPAAVPAVTTLAKWACQRDGSSMITKEKRHIHKLCTHLLQLHHAIKYKRESTRRDMLLAKLAQDMHTLRQVFARGSENGSQALERPFFILNNVIAEMRVGLG